METELARIAKALENIAELLSLIYLDIIKPDLEEHEEE